MNLKSMLPFLDEESLHQLIEKIIESPHGEYQGVTLSSVLPFAEEEDVDKMTLEGYQKGLDVHHCYPFASEEGLSKLVDFVVAQDEARLDLRPLLPFIESEDISKISSKILAKGGSFGGLSLDNLFPFMDEEDVDKTFVEQVKNHNPSASKMAPFASEEAFHELAQEYAKGSFKDFDLDTFYPFMDEADIRLVFQTALKDK